MTSAHTIVPLAPNHRQAATAALCKAFQDDVMYTTVFPDAEARARAEARLWRAVIQYCLQFGRVDATPAAEGVACWLPPGGTQVSFGRMLRAGMGLLTSTILLQADDRDRFMRVLQHTDAQHHLAMGDTPHWYLWALGVAPDRQGMGIGGSLLKPVLKQADRDRVPCYLETQHARNAAFYEKRGFQTSARGRVPGLDLEMWIMTRDPR